MSKREALSGVLGLAVVLVLAWSALGDSDSHSTSTRGNVQRIASGEPAGVHVKYRSTPVNVATGNFEYWIPQSQGNVLEAWWDIRNQYLLINVRGTVYHYCGVSFQAWKDLTGSSAADFQYDTFIKGHTRFDCRRTQPPTYP